MAVFQIRPKIKCVGPRGVTPLDLQVAPLDLQVAPLDLQVAPLDYKWRLWITSGASGFTSGASGFTPLDYMLAPTCNPEASRQGAPHTEFPAKFQKLDQFWNPQMAGYQT